MSIFFLKIHEEQRGKIHKQLFELILDLLRFEPSQKMKMHTLGHTFYYKLTEDKKILDY